MAAVQPDMTRLQEHVPREREPYRTPGPGTYESGGNLAFHKQRESAFGGSLAAVKRFDGSLEEKAAASPVRVAPSLPSEAPLPVCTRRAAAVATLQQLRCERCLCRARANTTRRLALANKFARRCAQRPPASLGPHIASRRPWCVGVLLPGYAALEMVLSCHSRCGHVAAAILSGHDGRSVSWASQARHAVNARPRCASRVRFSDS